MTDSALFYVGTEPIINFCFSEAGKAVIEQDMGSNIIKMVFELEYSS